MLQPSDTKTLDAVVSQPEVEHNPLYDSWRTSEQYLISSVLSAGTVQRGSRVFAESIDGTGILYSDFFSRELAAIWYVMDRLYQNGDDIDITTIWAEIQKSSRAKQFMTLDMLMFLLSQGKAGAHRTHAVNVVDASVSANITTALQQLQPLVDDPKIKALEKLQEVYKIVTDLSKRLEHFGKSQTIGLLEGLKSYLKTYEDGDPDSDIAISTGFAQLDAKIDGWKDRTLNVIAGPPGSGKTVMLMNSALQACMAGKRVLMVQLELPPEQSFRRLLCAFSGIDSNRLKRRQLTNWEAQRLPEAIEQLQALDADKHFTLLTMNQPTLDDIRLKLDTLMFDGYDIIFFDYAGGAKIARSHASQNDLEHHREIYNAIDDWKKRYNVPVVVGAQYNQSQPQAHAGDYNMDMIYSSKFMKHNADTILFLHPVTSRDNGGAGANMTQFVVVKNRDGEKPYGSNLVVTAKAEMNMFRFVDSTQVSSLSSVPLPMWAMGDATG